MTGKGLCWGKINLDIDFYGFTWVLENSGAVGVGTQVTELGSVSLTPDPQLLLALAIARKWSLMTGEPGVIVFVLQVSRYLVPWARDQ